MSSLRKIPVAGLALALLTPALPAQTIVSARSGLIHYVEGEAWLDDVLVDPKPSEFPEIKEKSTFRTGEGRAEILLNSGVFLRLAENTSVKMISNRLIDTRILLLAGSVMVEAAEILPDNAITIAAGDSATAILKRGLYAFDTDPLRVRVYDGEASVDIAGTTVAVKDDRMLPLDGSVTTPEKFDSKIGNPLYRWSRRRSEYVAMANASAAHSLRRSGASWRTSGWQWNPWYGMYTFIPASGIAYSPFGFGYFSPGAVYAIYRPQPIYTGGGFGGGGSIGYDSRGGYVTAPRGMGSVVSGGSSSAASSMPTSPSVGAGASRGSGGASRGSSAGGGRGR